jgi:hypothetical protein
MNVVSVRSRPKPPPPLADIDRVSGMLPNTVDWDDWKSIHGGGFRSWLRFVGCGGLNLNGATVDPKIATLAFHYRLVKKQECHVFGSDAFCFHESAEIHPDLKWLR